MWFLCRLNVWFLCRLNETIPRKPAIAVAELASARQHKRTGRPLMGVWWGGYGRSWRRRVPGPGAVGVRHSTGWFYCSFAERSLVGRSLVERSL